MTDEQAHLVHRRRWILAIAGVVALAVCAGAIATAGSNHDSEFVVAAPESGYTLRVDKKNPSFTLSSLFLRHPGAEIRILDVQALTSPNVEYVGAVTVWPGEFAKMPFVIGPGFPSPEITQHHPLGEAVPAGATDLTPKPGVTSAPPMAVAAGFRVVSGDMGAVNGVRVVYTVNGKKVTEDFRQSVLVCVKPRSCSTPDGENPKEYLDTILRQFGLLPEKS